MKKIFSIIFAAILSTGLFASGGMIITQTYKDAGNSAASITVTWYVSETQCKMKMEYADGKINSTTYFIPDAAAAKLLTYSDGAAPGASQKNYFSLPVQNIKGNADVTRVNVTRTGETKTLAGIVCEKVIIKTNRSTTEMWLTRDFKPDFYKFSPFFQSSVELLGLSQDGIQGMPLESTTRDNSGAIISSYTLISAQNAQLNAGDFAVPSDYKNAETTTK
jgi:Domain of unknown function (DUF4412)